MAFFIEMYLHSANKGIKKLTVLIIITKGLFDNVTSKEKSY